MKKLVCAILPLLFLVLLLPQITHAAAATTSIQLYLDGKKLTPEVAPRKIGDTSMVPLRIISESLGAKVTWDGEQRKVTVSRGKLNIQLRIDSKDAVVNGKTEKLERASTIVAGNTLIPVRFVAEKLGVNVDWDDKTQSVKLKNSADNTSNDPAPIVIEDNNASAAPSAGPDSKPTASPSPKPAASPSAAPSPSGTAPDKPVIEVPVIVVNASPSPQSGAASPMPDTNAKLYPELLSVRTVNDRIEIEAAGELKPKLLYLSGPERLVIDLPGVAFGSKLTKPAPGTMGEVASQSPQIAKIRYAMNAPETSTVRIVLELKSKTGYRLVDTGSRNKIAVELKNVNYKIVIDPGHGDQDPGAISVTGKYEKDFNLAMGLKVKALLDNVPGVQATLTRSDDTFVELDKRCDIANDLGADVFVSIHANKYTAATSGTETYYQRPESLGLANILHKAVVEAAGLPDKKVRQNDFRVITHTIMPAVLLEIGYLSNVNDESRLFSASFQDKVAAAIVNGIKQYLGIS